MNRKSFAPAHPPRVLLIGDPAARPAGLERALTRSGFQLVERDNLPTEPDADAVLVTVKDITEESLGGLLTPRTEVTEALPPRVVIIAAPDRDAPAAALSLGAQDALSAPIHLPELCARLHAQVRKKLLREAGGAPVEKQPTASNGRSPGVSPETVADSGEGLQVLERRVREEFERARRYSLSFSLILLGVDELTGVRERQGPDAAERLKQDVEQILRRELRVPDFVIGYGADEFAIVLPETGPAGARQSVLRVRERLAGVSQEGDPRDRPRFSAGIVTYPHPAISQCDELYGLLEAALLRAKAQTGERIGVAV